MDSSISPQRKAIIKSILDSSIQDVESQSITSLRGRIHSLSPDIKKKNYNVNASKGPIDTSKKGRLASVAKSYYRDDNSVSEESRPDSQ